MPFVSPDLIDRIELNQSSTCKKIVMVWSNPTEAVYLKYRDRIEHINPAHRRWGGK